MSGIAKPLIHSTATVGGVAEPVNVEMLKDMNKLDIPVVRPDLDDRIKYVINFAVLGTDNQMKNVEWNYGTGAAALAARDAGFDAALALASTAV